MGPGEGCRWLLPAERGLVWDHQIIPKRDPGEGGQQEPRDPHRPREGGPLIHQNVEIREGELLGGILGLILVA